MPNSKEIDCKPIRHNGAIGKYKRLLVTILILMIIVPSVAIAKGKYKPGEYDERYEIPFSQLFWRGKTYKKGTCEIWVDLTDIARNEPPKLQMQFNSTSGKTIGRYTFCPIDGIKAELIYRPDSLTYKTATPDPILWGKRTETDYHILMWNTSTLVFKTVIPEGGTASYHIILMVEDGDDVEEDDNGIECVFADSNVHHIFENVFECARRLGAVTYKEDPFEEDFFF